MVLVPEPTVEKHTIKHTEFQEPEVVIVYSYAGWYCSSNLVDELHSCPRGRQKKVGSSAGPRDGVGRASRSQMQ